MKKAKKVPVRFTRKPTKKKVRTKAQRRAAALKSWADRKAKAELDAQLGSAVVMEVTKEAAPAVSLIRGGESFPDACGLPKKATDGSFVSVYKSDGDLFITVAAPNTIYTRHITPAELRGIVQQAVLLLPTP